MQDISQRTKEENTQNTVETVTSLLDLPVARLQIVQAGGVLKTDWLKRSMIEPTLSQNADGLWVLTVRRQGEHSKFAVPYIGSEILLADAELGLIMVLVGYHGSETEKYGRLGYMTQKGQFYRYYQQQADGGWCQIKWPQINDELRQFLLDTVKEQGPEWAKSPGKLQSERKPPTRPVTMTSYKVVRLINEKYYSLYDPTLEYVLGQRLKEPAKPKHGGGFFSFPTKEYGTEFLASCVRCDPFHEDVNTPQFALLECEIGGRIIHYGHKMASTYLRPMQVLEVRFSLN
jgi:hypothetical protein